MDTIDPTQSMPASDSSLEIAVDVGPDYFRKLSGEEAARVDEVCDVFETKLLTGQQPRIEDYLAGFKGDVRSALVCELLILEIEHLKASGKVPDPIEYRDRLAQDVKVVDRVFDHLFPRPVTVTVDAEEAEIRIPEYQLQRKLGSGGMGTVYKGIQLSLERDVAIKVLREDRVSDVDSRLRFMQEMKVVGQLKHPNIVEAYDAGHPSGVYYLAMEYIDGLDLSAVLRRCGPLPVADACEVARRAAMGLQKAHRLNLVHRDIKPSNLLLGRASSHDDHVELKIADLGLARLGAVAAKQAEESEYRHVLGTFDFMAPEQFFSPDKVDIRADIYSLGCTMYSLLLGKAPFSGRKFNNAVQKMKAHQGTPPPRLRHVRPDVPEELEAMIQKMAAKSPEQRFQTPEDLAEALGPFCDGYDLTELLLSAEESEERQTTGKQIMISPTVSRVDMESPTEKVEGTASPPPVQHDSMVAAETDATDAKESETETRLEGSPVSRRKLVAATGVALGALALAAVVWIAMRQGGEGQKELVNGKPKTIDLLARVQPAQDSIGGNWVMEDNALVSPAASKTWLLLRSDPAEPYKLEIEVPENGASAFAIGIVRNGDQIPIVDSVGQRNDSPQNSGNKMATAERMGFDGSRKDTYTCIVRQDGYLVAFEKSIIAVRLKGEPYAVSESWRPPRGKGLFLAARGGVVRVTAIRLTPLSSATDD